MLSKLVYDRVPLYSRLLSIASLMALITHVDRSGETVSPGLCKLDNIMHITARQLFGTRRRRIVRAFKYKGLLSIDYRRV